MVDSDAKNSIDGIPQDVLLDCLVKIIKGRSKTQEEIRKILEELGMKKERLIQTISENLSENLSEEISRHAIYQALSEEYLQGHEALVSLKKSQLRSIKTLSTATGVTKNHVISDMSIPINRLVSIMEMLLKEFKEEGITITPRVETSKGVIDLFIKTSDRRRFALLFRSNGCSKIKWDETRQDFFALRKGGKSKWSELKLQGEALDDGLVYLRAEKNLLMGDNNTERKKAFTKAIVLTGETRLAPSNDPERIVSFGRTTALRVYTKSVFYVVDGKNLADFIRKPEK
jgi:hypothetical protein